MQHMTTTNVLHVVFDRYYDKSIKSCCRLSRAKGLSRIYQLTSESPLPKPSLVPDVTANKTQVIKMIVDDL